MVGVVEGIVIECEGYGIGNSVVFNDYVVRYFGC